MLRAIAFVISFVVLSASGDAAEQKHTACIQNYGGNCGQNTDVFVYCRSGESQQQTGNRVCGVRTETGVQNFPSAITAGPGGAGGLCGFRVLNITCRAMPDDSRVEWHYDICQGERPGACTNGFRHFGCEATEQQIAQSYCMKDGITAPYQIFKYSDKSGNRCGYALYMVGCHFPVTN